MKRIVKYIIPLAVLLVVLSFLIWFRGAYLILDGRIYARNSTSIVLTEPELPDIHSLLSFPDLQVWTYAM